MADIDLEEITVQRREVEVEGQIRLADEDPPANTRKGKKRRQSRQRQNSSSGNSLQETQRHSPLVFNGGQDHGGALREEGNREPDGHPADGKEKVRELPQEDLRAQFYEHYRKEAEEYDKEFMKKHDEDLNTTLIFAGLFSAVTSAFIIQVHPQLQPDPADETAALLRVILYKMDNTVFGGNVPSLPQWTSAPRAAIQVQAMLYASLAASLFSAFLAMLGKQWLNRYVSNGMRGTGIERSWDRQRKLDGIITWYFDHVMESLPLMLQVALLLLGCALSLYLWEIHVTVACVVVSVTALGVTLYAFFVIAGTVSASCPYQTPGARILRHIHYHVLPHILYHILSPILSLLHSASISLVSNSSCLHLFTEDAWDRSWNWKENIIHLIAYILSFPYYLAHDVYKLTWETVKALTALVRGVPSWIHSACPARVCQLNQRTAMLDSQCVSWILQMSLEKGIRLSTLKFLATVPTLADFTPALVSECFDILIDCIKVNKGNPAVVQGMEQLGEVSALCFFLTYSHLSVMDPIPSALVGIHQRYRRIFPLDLDPGDFPFPYTLGAIQEAIHPRGQHNTSIDWRDYKPTNHEYAAIAHALSKVYWFRNQRESANAMSYQCLRFAYHSLTQDPLPPPPIITDCLLIIAIQLRCNVPSTMILEESAQPEEVRDLITQKLNDTDCGQFFFDERFGSIDVLFPYAIQQEQRGETGLFDAILHLAKVDFRILGIPVSLLDSIELEPFAYASPRVIILATPYLDLEHASLSRAKNLIPKWVATISVAPRTEEVARDVVNALLQIAANPDLRPLIPSDVWLWLNERPFLPSESRGRLMGGCHDIFRTVRGLNNIEVLTSYLTMVWPKYYRGGFAEMQMSVREDFNGIGAGCHRAELIQRVDGFLGGSDREPGVYIRERHEEIKRILQEVDQEATEILNQSHSTFMCALPLLCP